MGCDIHCYVEYTEKFSNGNEFTHCVGRMYPGRSYAMFSLMAAVREHPPYTPLFQPKGPPNDMSYTAQWDYTVIPGDGLSAELIDEWVERGLSLWIDEERKIATNPDWHSASWLSGEELEKVVKLYSLLTKRQPNKEWLSMLAAVKALGSTGRLTFWFDN